MFVKLLFVFLFCCALVFFLQKLVNYRNRKITFSYLKKFFLIRKINSYKPCHPLFYCSKNKRKKAVLLLHGFSGAPDEMVELVAVLKQNDIPYLAPLFPGFGIGDFHLLNVVNEKDWVREAVYSYDLLAQIADKVDVIGHSNGGSIAIVLSSLRPINKLILSSPYLFPSSNDEIIEYLITNSFCRFIIKIISPIILKPKRKERFSNTDTCDFKGALKEFNYKSIPFNSLCALLAMKEWAKKEVCNLKDSKTYVLYGELDQTISNRSTFSFLEKNNIRISKISYSRSGHNILADYDREKVNKDILVILEEDNQS